MNIFFKVVLSFFVLIEKSHSQIPFNFSLAVSTNTTIMNRLPFDFFSNNQSITALFYFSHYLPITSAYKSVQKYSEFKEMNCYSISMFYSIKSVLAFRNAPNTFLNFDPKTNRLFYQYQTFSLASGSPIVNISIPNPFISAISSIPIDVLSVSKIIKIQSIGNGNSAIYLNQTLIVGGSVLTLYDTANNFRARIQITVYLNGQNNLFVSELFNNTFYIAVYDNQNDRIIISSISDLSIKTEFAVFEFFSLPSGQYAHNQKKSFILTIDQTTGILYIIVLFKTSPIIKLRLNPSVQFF